MLDYFKGLTYSVGFYADQLVVHNMNSECVNPLKQSSILE